MAIDNHNKIEYINIMAKKKTEHYVDNKLFLEAMKEYRKSCNKAKKEKKNLITAGSSEKSWWQKLTS